MAFINTPQQGFASRDFKRDLVRDLIVHLLVPSILLLNRNTVTFFQLFTHYIPNDRIQ